MSQNRLLKNITLLSIVQIANYVFPLVTVPIVSRIIGPEKYGVLNYAFTFVSYFTILITYGFDLTATRRISKDPTNVILRNNVFNEVFTAQQILFVISVIIFIPCIFFIPPLAMDKRVSILTFLICISTLFTQNWIFQAMQNLSIVAILNFIGRFLGAASVLILVRYPNDYYWQAFSTSISAIVVAILSCTLAIKKYNIKYKRVTLRQVLILLKNEKSVFVSMVVISLYTTTNTVMLGLLRPTIEIGYYSSAQRLMTVITSVINYPINQAFFPYVGKAFGVSKENGLSVLKSVSPIIILFMFFVTIILFLSGPIVINLFYGDKFTESVLVFKIIAFVPLVVCISNILGIQTMLNLKMDKPFLNITLGGAAVGLVMNYLMIQWWGYIGTGINWFVVEFMISLTMFVYLNYVGINPITLKSFSPTEIFNTFKKIKIRKSL